MGGSELKIYSYGIAAENKKLGSRVLEVTPVEDMPLIDGEINSDLVDETITSKDSTGSEFQVKATTANSIPATWLPMGSSNRLTPPDIRRGERVVLYRFSDEAKFFWTTLHDDLKLRRLETAIYAWSGTKNEAVTEVTAANYYFLEVSTHKGLVTFHTSKANGEFAGYDVQINAKEGYIRIQDDLGQLITFDSKERQIAMKNSDDCYIEINKKNVTIQAPETYTLRAKNKVEEIGETIDIKAGNSITEKTTDYSIEASSSLSEKTATYDLDASGAVTESASSYDVHATGLIKLQTTGPIKIDGNGVVIKRGVALG